MQQFLGADLAQHSLEPRAAHVVREGRKVELARCAVQYTHAKHAALVLYYRHAVT